MVRLAANGVEHVIPCDVILDGTKGANYMPNSLHFGSQKGFASLAESLHHLAEVAFTAQLAYTLGSLGKT